MRSRVQFDFIFELKSSAGVMLVVFVFRSHGALFECDLLSFQDLEDILAMLCSEIDDFLISTAIPDFSFLRF